MALITKNTDAPRRNRWSLVIWGTAALLLLLPAVAMRFTSEVDWTASDFIFMGVMLGAACAGYELLARMCRNSSYRAAAGIAIATAFLTVWANAAVGMLGSEDNLANLLFGGVLAVGLVGGLVAKFRAPGMARAMEATAVAQAAMTVYALVGGHADVVLLVGFFIIPWLLSAQLFRKAARQQVDAGAAGRLDRYGAGRGTAAVATPPAENRQRRHGECHQGREINRPGSFPS